MIKTNYLKNKSNFILLNYFLYSISFKECKNNKLIKIKNE
jgi:hypothetical protein